MVVTDWKKEINLKTKDEEYSEEAKSLWIETFNGNLSI